MKKLLFIIVSGIIFFSCDVNHYDEDAVPPDAPSDLSVTALSFCRVLVTWTDNSDNERSFVLERSENSSFDALVTINVDFNATGYSDRQDIDSETEYFYRVKAENAAGESAYTAVQSDTTPSYVGTLISGSRIADHTVINYLRNGVIPVGEILSAKSTLHIGYGHTSHGSQITSGMNGLVSFASGSGLGGSYSSYPDLFDWNRGGTDGALDLREGDGYGEGPLDHDAGYYPNWVEETTEFLDDPANYEVNVIMWSWCGQVSSQTSESMISNYLDPMTQLEADYPDITFIYMTGHLDGTGLAGNLHERNEQIRDYCTANDKWLFDFADIESYDPDGTYFGDRYATDGCVYDFDGDGTAERDGETTPINGDRNWALDWQDAHTEGTDWYNCGAAHSVSVNANMKAYAVWWLWGRLAGWNP